MFYKDTFKQQIAQYLSISPQNIFLFWKGRVALYAILKSLGINPGDEVILPSFTCVVAVNPIIYIGAKPVYVDIDPTTYNIDPTKIEEKITPKTKAILAQNTFGLSPDLDAIFKIAKKYNLVVIEDCAHGFGGFYKGRPNGTIADLAFFSSQWNKPFSTGLGGIAVIKNNKKLKKVRDNLYKLEQEFIKPSFKDRYMLKTLLFIKDYFLSNYTYWLALKTYRWLSKHNLILGSSQGEELEGPNMPKDFKKGFSEIQAKRGIKELKNIDLTIAHRRKIADLYKKILRALDIEPPYEPQYAIHTYLKFPILVRDRQEFFKKAEKENIELGDWFISPIHPIRKNFEYWYYKWGENPVAEKISQHIVNLPTHRKINKKYIMKIVEFLRKHQNDIINYYNIL